MTQKGITGHTVSRVAELLELHPKTVRRFIREGRLEATKVGREYRIPEAALRDYCHGELAQGPGPRPEERRIASLAERVQVSAVIEVREGDEAEVSRISNSIIAVLSCKDPAWGASRYDLIYHPETQTARFVLNGRPAFIRALLEALEVLTDEGGR